MVLKQSKSYNISHVRTDLIFFFNVDFILKTIVEVDNSCSFALSTVKFGSISEQNFFLKKSLKIVKLSR